MNATEDFILEPTVIMRLDLEADTYGFVTADEGAGEYLIVFRNPEDARAFQQDTGKYTPEEGCKLLGVYETAIAAILKKSGVKLIAMPQSWAGGDERVDTFKGEDFIEMLEESPRAH